ncbi:HpcH/HpaI aldolase family protein [Pollutibacter soli]|uniref:HpcH/HpaI aldolase family protein n=1 Tax=Pollutibacter soli TaxID=3034157 RepID=UPI0030139A97
MNSKKRQPESAAPLSLGTWMSIGSPVISELASLIGFDWLLFDLEHGNLTEAALQSNLQAVAPGPVQSIVRVPGVNPYIISRALDWGAAGIMLPHVSGAEEINECLKAMQYPPFGNRGYSSSARQYQYGMKATEAITSLKPLLFAQIEDVKAIQNIDAIASVSGIDVLFVGPADLQLSISSSTDFDITYREALAKVCQTAKSHHITAGILAKDKNEFSQHIEMGFTCIAVLSDLAILRSGYQQILNAFDKERCAGKTNN